MKVKRTWSWRTRLLVLLLLFAVVPVTGITLWNLAQLEAAFEEDAVESLRAIGYARADAIDQLMDDRRRDVELLASQLVPHLEQMGMANREAEALEPPETAPAPLPAPLPELEDAQGGEPFAPTATETPEAGASPEADAGAAESGEGAAESGEGAGASRPQASARAVEIEEARRQQAVAAEAEAKAELYQALALILLDQKVFEELLVISEDGLVVASTYNRHEGKTADGLEYFQNGLKATFLQPIFLSPITDRLTMVISTPIRAPDTRVLGVLAARLNLTRFFRLINDLTGLGETGEIVVGKFSEGKVVFMAPTRLDANAALQRTVEIGSKQGRPLQEAARGLKGSGEHELDYRGVEVIAAWQPVPSLSWGLVVKIDYEEAMDPVHAVASQTLLVALGLLLMAVIAAYAVSRELVRPLRTLKDAVDHISRGHLDVQLEIRSSDEIGELADSFERMVAAIKYFREHARREEEDESEFDSTDHESDSGSDKSALTRSSDDEPAAS